MQRILFIGLIGIVFGCTPTGTNGTPESPAPAKTTEPAKATTMEISAPKAPQGEPTHLVVADSQYYANGPQQARPPDGTLKAGTKVFLLEENGSYVMGQTTDGLTGHISASAIKPIE